MRNTATSCTSQSLNWHIRITEPSGQPQYKNLLQGFSHTEPFSLYNGLFHHSQFFLFHCPPHRCLCVRTCFPRLSEGPWVSSFSQDCTGLLFIPVQVSTRQPTPIRQVQMEVTEQTYTLCYLMSHTQTLEEDESHAFAISVSISSLPWTQQTLTCMHTLLSQSETRICWLTNIQTHLVKRVKQEVLIHTYA